MFKNMKKTIERKLEKKLYLLDFIYPRIPIDFLDITYITYITYIYERRVLQWW